MAVPVKKWILPTVVGVLAIAGVVWYCWPTPPAAKPIPEEPTFPLAPVSDSPFLNTKPDAKYVGSASCTGCHEKETQSYHHTGMGRSMATVDLGREPPDGAYDHPASKRRYAVERKDGQLRHRESLIAGNVVLQDHPVKYVVGSGRHSLTYLVETDGFLVESPITWYRSKNAWAMSPGYDTPLHGGFEQAIGEGCLFCHAGRAEAIDGSLHRMKVIEAAIGCERCHGPGSLHVEMQTNGKAAANGIDRTIVNPKHLSRDLAEAVCMQCHLRSSATIEGRGRGSNAYRPGLPLQDFRQDYALEVPDRPMTVVGHVEQMHLSKCYVKSDTLTCTTCHNPHGEPEAKDRERFYNGTCATCHKPAACKVDPAVRAKESPANNCVGCHMPASPTEIPHLAFTHHRIGIHSKDAKPKAVSGMGTLRPFLDVSRLSEIDRARSLGLAYLEVANRERDPANSAEYRRRAHAILGEVIAAGLRDPALDAAMARLSFDLQLPGGRAFAVSALYGPGLTAQDRCNALFILAEDSIRKGEPEEARTRLEELTKLRRHPSDWLLLADARQQFNAPDAAIDALERAVRINPRLPRIQTHLADYHRTKGDATKADWHKERAVP